MSQSSKANFLASLTKLSEYLPTEVQTTNDQYLNGHTTNELLLEFFQIGKHNLQFSDEEKQSIRKLLPRSFDNIIAGITYSFSDLTSEKLITAQTL